jgi:hypothetical protein
MPPKVDNNSFFNVSLIMRSHAYSHFSNYYSQGTLGENLTDSPSGDIIAATSNTSILVRPLGMLKVSISNFFIPSKHFLICLFTL